MKKYTRYYADTDVGKAGDATYDETFLHRVNGVDGLDIDGLTPVPVPSIAGTDGLAVYNSPVGRIFALVENANVADDADLLVPSIVTVSEGQSELAVADIEITIGPTEKYLIGPFSANFNATGRFRMVFSGSGTLAVGDLTVNFFKFQ